MDRRVESGARAPVEASIALSIVFVASEIVHMRQGRASVTQSYPCLVALTFGLLRGFGFAGALAEVGLPQSSTSEARSPVGTLDT